MDYLVDTNILLRFVDRANSQHAIVREAVRKLRVSGESLRATSQNFTEFWDVATRPATRNGFGLTTQDTAHRLGILERLFPLLPDSAAVYPAWRGLVVT